MFEIIIVPYRKDNYGFLLHQAESRTTIAIDAGDDVSYLDALEIRGWQLDYILITHHHDDHISHLAALQSQTGAKTLGPKGVSGLDEILSDGDQLDLPNHHRLKVIATPGHTNDMLNFYLPDSKAIFTGDTLFTLGCGALFEGTPETMFNSLQKLKALPPDTLIYGAHEYTLTNLNFALSQFPDHAPLLDRQKSLHSLRASEKPTVPSPLKKELESNPFLLARSVQEFAALRAAKDNF